MFTLLYKKDAVVVAFLIGIFIFIRSVNFQQHLNFSQEPASHAMDTHRLWSEKKIELIGPANSFQFNGRRIFQSSIGYYFMMLFLVPAGFEPIASSYFFMLFCAVSLIPLYFGTKMLLNKNCAVYMAILYALFPFYIDFTRFFWYPNFQLALSPYILLAMGLYKKHKNPLWLFMTGAGCGALILFHYQYLLIFIGLFVHYIFFKKITKKHVVYFALGVIIGLSPHILFEVRNNFYNTQTVILFLQNYKQVFGKNGGIPFSMHYILNPSLFIILIALSMVKKKIHNVHIVVLFIALFVLSLFLYLPTPSHAYGTTKNWNFLDEKRVYEIIRKENLNNFNIANLGYDTVAVVQKYLLKIDGISGIFDDYYHNEYLYVISDTADFMKKTKSYEVTTFAPSTLITKWNINDTYDLYLLKRE